MTDGMIEARATLKLPVVEILEDEGGFRSLVIAFRFLLV
jgi:hypothetical protein